MIALFYTYFILASIISIFSALIFAVSLYTSSKGSHEVSQVCGVLTLFFAPLAWLLHNVGQALGL